MISNIQGLRPAVSRVIVTVGIVHFRHPKLFSCPFLFKKRIRKIAERGAISVCTQDIHIRQCLRIVQNRVGHIFQVREGFRCNNPAINGPGIFFHKFKHLCWSPPRPGMCIIRLILDRNRVKIHTIILHKRDKIIKMLRIRSILIVSEPFGCCVAIAIKGLRHVTGRIPGRSKNDSSVSDCRFCSFYFSIPVIFILVHIDSQDRKP
ncbi:hypothetical protein D3C75_896850 [compost metagenome]